MEASWQRASVLTLQIFGFVDYLVSGRSPTPVQMHYAHDVMSKDRKNRTVKETGQSGQLVEKGLVKDPTKCHR